MSIEVELSVLEEDLYLSEDEELAVTQEAVDDRHRCVICGRNMKCSRSLQRHIRESHNSNLKVFECPVRECSSLKKRRHDLGRHLRLVHKINFKESICLAGEARMWHGSRERIEEEKRRMEEEKQKKMEEEKRVRIEEKRRMEEEKRRKMEAEKMEEEKKREEDERQREEERRKKKARGGAEETGV